MSFFGLFRMGILAVAALASAPTIGATEAFFSDSFESGDQSASANGFSWSRTGGNVFVSKEAARTGSHSLCFRYSGKPSGEDSTAEQRFKLGSEYTDLWIQFYVRFPANYRHRSDSPPNNKFLMLWSRSYQDVGVTAGLHLWSDGSNNSNISYTAGVTSPHFPLQKNGGHPRMISVDRDLEKWIEVTYHWKRQSTETSQDGVIELWRKVGDGPRQKIFSETNLDRTWSKDGGSNPGYNFIDQGYLLGWANSGFDEDTTICIDDVQFSNKPLISQVEPKKVSGVEVR